MHSLARLTLRRRRRICGGALALRAARVPVTG
jgi:hypothetical protein